MGSMSLWAHEGKSDTQELTLVRVAEESQERSLWELHGGFWVGSNAFVLSQ